MKTADDIDITPVQRLVADDITPEAVGSLLAAKAADTALAALHDARTGS